MATIGDLPFSWVTLSTILSIRSLTLESFKFTWAWFLSWFVFSAAFPHYFADLFLFCPSLMSMATSRFMLRCVICVHQELPRGKYQCLQRTPLLFCSTMCHAPTMRTSGTPGLPSPFWPRRCPVSATVAPQPLLVIYSYLNAFLIVLAGLFTVVGFYQMAIWALGKHRNYKKEFPNYPKRRKAIVPFLL